MIPKEQQAAQLLAGRTIGDGWKVIKKMERLSHHTGGVYSCCYEVKHEDDRRGFLKAFDYSGAEKVGKNSAELMRDILNAYVFERDILTRCSEASCKNVIRLLDTGNYDVSEAEKYPRVEFLILEYADKGDIRSVLQEKSVTLAWKMRSLHQLANGLRQIHRLSIVHQDIKPSNAVTIATGITKITDFGSAISIDGGVIKEIPAHLKKDYAGSWEYAPPELLYGEVNDNVIIRRIGCDLYLLGSMIAFYFTNTSMTALIRANLVDDLSWTNTANQGHYKEVLSFLKLSFSKALTDVKFYIDKEEMDEDVKQRIMDSLKYLCNPDPNERGHVKNIKQNYSSNYGLERFVSSFDFIASRLELKNKAVVA